jgi:hypothetical protein
MAEQEILKMSALDIFAATQETFEEAKKKNNEESSTRITYLRFKNDGTYSVRILPLAPVINADGQALPMERKGYEYPLRTLMLKITDTQADGKGKPKITYVSVCNAKHAFKDKIKSDLIDAYVNRACEIHADDEALCKKLREGSFNGGLRWDSKRCMYVIDLDNPGDGIKILQLSFAQYKDLEERKLNIWSKLNKGGQKVPCPISSIDSAYPVEIVRKTENGKASYSFNIDTISGQNKLDEETLQKLLDTPRLPESLYRYTRYHLEATIAYLNQLDEQYGIDIMHDGEVRDCIEQIKCLLPADDQSHFTIGHNKTDGDDKGATVETIDSLWERLDRLDEADLDDKSSEGQELRASIKEYIDNNDLDVRITHSKSNADLLQEIDDALNNDNKKDADKDEEDDEPAEPVDDYDESEPSTRGRERNDDTNEPAVRASRRDGRPSRRRV